MRIGIDVGGTNTDGVLLDDGVVLAKTKSPTTEDITSGIRAVLAELLRARGALPEDVTAVMIGTTHFTNAFVHGDGLCPVGVIRLGLPATQAVPPMADWPDEVRDRLRTRVFLCHGGVEFDGRPIAGVVEEEIRDAAAQLMADGIRSIAVSAVHSPIDPRHERRVAEILAEAMPEAMVSLSHEVGRMGLLERENATIVNAALRPLAQKVAGGFAAAVADSELECPVYVSQNDGTLATMEYIESHPVATFTSGPTNSMRGAAFLSALTDAIIVDIGGTTTDIGVIRGGFPQESGSEALVGGVRTNFRLPDVLSLGIGGGSLVRRGAAPAVGPGSVGYRLRDRALVFGGDTLTATDVAVAGSRADVGERALVGDLGAAEARAILDHIDHAIADAADRMRTSAAPLPVVIVGGGSILLGDSLPGVAEVHRPPHFEVANAVGAAIAQVGGTCERILSLARISRDEAIAQVTAAATEQAVAAGADPDTVQIVDVEEVAMAYLPDAQTRFKARAVGTIAPEVAHALHR